MARFLLRAQGRKRNGSRAEAPPVRLTQEIAGGLLSASCAMVSNRRVIYSGLRMRE